MKVLFFGDSLVAGKGDPEGLGWVERVAEATRRVGTEIAVRNFGVPGETSTEICARWQRQTAPEITRSGPCRVVFSFGANDTTEEFGRLRVEPADSRRNLSEALSTAAGLGLPVLVVGPAPVNDGAQHQRILTLSDEFATICGKAKVPFVAVAAGLIAQGDWVRQARDGDGAHPASRGYEVMAGLVLDPWLQWIATPALSPTHSAAP